jgi:hypothetical protein
MEGQMLQMGHPENEKSRQGAVPILTRLRRRLGKSLKKGMAMKDCKLIQHIITILTLLDNLGHCRSIEKTSAFVAKSLSEQGTKNILDVNLGIQAKIRKPNAKGKTITVGVSRGRVEAPALQMGHNTGVPSEEIATVKGWKGFQNAFRKSHFKGTIKGTEKEILILELNVQGDRMTTNITTVRTMGDPHGNQASVRVHNEVGALGIRLKHGPGGAVTGGRVATMTKKSVTTRAIVKITSIVRLPTWIGMSAPVGTRTTRSIMSNRRSRGQRVIANVVRNNRSRSTGLGRSQDGIPMHRGGRRVMRIQMVRGWVKWRAISMMVEDLWDRRGGEMNRRASPGRKGRIMAGGIEETSNSSLEVITMVANGGQAIGHVAKEDWG